MKDERSALIDTFGMCHALYAMFRERFHAALDLHIDFWYSADEQVSVLSVLVVNVAYRAGGSHLANHNR